MSRSLTVDVHRCGLIGPGLPDWTAAMAVLRGDRDYQPAPMAKPIASQLPSRERRRHTFAIALAVSTAMQAARLDDQSEIPSVFACSGGDTEVIDRICNALVQPGHPVSPQQFINSVHNAPAGHWSIAKRNGAPTTSLSAYDATFAAGLLEAAVQIQFGRPMILLVAYDAPAPMPIWPFRPLIAPFATALMLTAPDYGGEPTAQLDLTLRPNLDETTLDQPELERLRQGNPAARSLPLLQALATRQSTGIALAYLASNALSVRVTPC
ncbi:MAG: beta-ketoacyl synthase chain length factor [Geminicoccaceae bacterium]